MRTSTSRVQLAFICENAEISTTREPLYRDTAKWSFSEIRDNSLHIAHCRSADSNVTRVSTTLPTIRYLDNSRREHGLNGEADGRDGQGGRPLIIKDR